jgi:hypothetical protein
MSEDKTGPHASMADGDETPPMEQLAAVETNNARPQCFASTLQEVLFVVTATMAIAMQAMLSGSTTVTSSFIGRDLHMSTAEITWITSASSLSSGAFLLFFGKLADLFGMSKTHYGDRQQTDVVEVAKVCSSARSFSSRSSH